ncbi:MAG: hypothetical protein AB7D51_05085, partial [Desulfovibrionaceae bacterium]
MKLPLHLEHVLKESGLAPDSPALLRAVLARPGFRRFAFRFLRLRFTPTILERIRALDLPLDERAELFTSAISFINVHETYKTTGRDRTRLVDEAILALAQGMDNPTVLDVGVSDGTASLNLVRRMNGRGAVILADRHPFFHRAGPRAAHLVLDGDRRLLGVRVLGLYLNLALAKRLARMRMTPISTVNPLVEATLGVNPIRAFDITRDALDTPVAFIKCANVLNRKYFGDDGVRAAAANMARSLVPGGLLFLS